MKDRPAPPISRPAPKVNDPAKNEPPKVPTNAYERVTFFGRKVYNQLTASRLRIFVVGAFPFVAYISTSFIEYQRQRYEFRLQQSTFFKSSIAAIANSAEIRENYGKNIKLKRASFWTLSSGFVPWIRERHVWLGFSGNLADGWIRMGLRRTDFVLNKEIYKALAKQIENELSDHLKECLAMEGKSQRESEVSDNNPDPDNPDNRVSEVSAGTEAEVSEVSESSRGEVSEVNESSRGEVSGESVVGGKSEKLPTSGDSSEYAESADVGLPIGEEKAEKELTAMEIMKQKILAKEVRDKSHSDASKEYLKKVRTLYPQLSENFSQNDLEQAIALKKDRLLMGQAFDKTWDLLSLTVHPAEKSADTPVYVLYDPEDSYVDQGDYVFDSSFFYIKRREGMKTEIVTREITPT